MPKTINQNQLIRIFKDSKENKLNEVRFCFLIGAGASRSSNIPTGWELANKWYNVIKEDLDEKDLKAWQEAIKFDEKKISEYYPQIYEKRFESCQEAGYDELKELMEGKEPSIGYMIMEQILAKENHNFVITTNFDFLIEDAVRLYTDTKPFSAGHETLAGFISTQTERPTIIKVHRDLFLHPFNEIGNTKNLRKEWKNALKPILKNFNLLVLGYGGNDGSMMDYLQEIDHKERKAIYWCKRDSKELNGKINKLLKNNDYLVSIENFDCL
ncbi:MAG: SIR2 family protein [Candidatus Cloacimonetes bacterium]|nr:SIR2 family protein [Candidatus Cloacimonadota bacterium]